MIEKTEDFAQTLNHSDRDALSEVLESIRLKGGRMEQLSLPAPAASHFAAGHRSLLIVVEGTLLVQPGEGEKVRLESGDVLLLPLGQAFSVNAIADGGSTAGAQWLWGTFEFDAKLAGRFMPVLPDAMVIRTVDSKAFTWLAIASQFAVAEIATPEPGSAVMISRIVELILIRLLRLWAASPELQPSWLAGAMDGALAASLAAMHADPGRKWSVPQLARIAGMSRSAFADRFNRIVGQPPSRYLIGLRLDKAAEILRAKNHRISEVATLAGYESEAAFSRAFKLRFGNAPSGWRSR